MLSVLQLHTCEANNPQFITSTPGSATHHHTKKKKKSQKKGIEAGYLRIENCCRKILYKVKKRMSEQNKNDKLDIKTKKSGAEKHKR